LVAIFVPNLPDGGGGGGRSFPAVGSQKDAEQTTTNIKQASFRAWVAQVDELVSMVLRIPLAEIADPLAEKRPAAKPRVKGDKEDTIFTCPLALHTLLQAFRTILRTT
jgi:hypothetical protein